MRSFGDLLQAGCGLAGADHALWRERAIAVVAPASRVTVEGYGVSDYEEVHAGSPVVGTSQFTPWAARCVVGGEMARGIRIMGGRRGGRGVYDA